jgi:hypothetical protein
MVYRATAEISGCLESEASSWALPDILKKHPGYQEAHSTPEQNALISRLFSDWRVQAMRFPVGQKPLYGRLV